MTLSLLTGLEILLGHGFDILRNRRSLRNNEDAVLGGERSELPDEADNLDDFPIGQARKLLVALQGTLGFGSGRVPRRQVVLSAQDA
ncbi:hypothetical protein [Xanthobacter sp. VNH20]|uniref:hypothetical protein n=1 Tax=Xanthobacter sp. VNH20 TaxID=3156616 RepID=UPI0032B5E2E3